jgi:hypothetical protein
MPYGIVWLSKKCYLSQATVQLTLFGKESFVDLDFEQIEAVEVDSNDSKLWGLKTPLNPHFWLW